VPTSINDFNDLRISLIELTVVSKCFVVFITYVEVDEDSGLKLLIFLLLFEIDLRDFGDRDEDAERSLGVDVCFGVSFKCAFADCHEDKKRDDEEDFRESDSIFDERSSF
jgi:hypothetical protein